MKARHNSVVSYRRLFGAPPQRDVTRMRLAVPAKNSISQHPGPATGFWRVRSVQLKRTTLSISKPRAVAERAWRDEGRGERRFDLVRVRSAGGWSGGVPFVSVMKAADLRYRHDAALGVRSDWARNRRVFVE